MDALIIWVIAVALIISVINTITRVVAYHTLAEIKCELHIINLNTAAQVYSIDKLRDSNT